MKKEPNNWISVSDCLPENDRDVLIVDNCGYMSVAFYNHSIKEWFCRCLDYPAYHSPGEFGEVTIIDGENSVIYWMELPNNPKK